MKYLLVLIVGVNTMMPQVINTERKFKTLAECQGAGFLEITRNTERLEVPEVILNYRCTKTN